MRSMVEGRAGGRAKSDHWGYRLGATSSVCCLGSNDPAMVLSMG